MRNEIEKVFLGQLAEVRITTEEKMYGIVSMIAPEADNQTRTFAVEVEIPNPDRSLLSGVSSEVKILLQEVKAHHFSAQNLCLDDQENIGVKAVDKDNKVLFYPVDIVDVDDGGVWVTGLPDEIKIITVGHFFVQPEDVVKPVKQL